jgi:hypothetical protein
MLQRNVKTAQERRAPRVLFVEVTAAWMAAILLVSSIASALPTPGGTRSIPSCNLTTSSPAWTRHLIAPVIGSDGQFWYDFDGDGIDDVVTPGEQDSDVYLAFGVPATTAARSLPSWDYVTVDTTPNVEGAGRGDFDGDGNQDICSTSQGDEQVRISFGPGTAQARNQAAWNTSITLTAVSTLGIGWMSCGAMDVDNDGHMDIVIGGSDSGISGQLSWLKGPATGKRVGANWTPKTDLVQTGRVTGFFIGNYTGSAHLDILFGTRNAPSPRTAILENDGDGTFTEREISTSIPVHGNSHVFMLFTPGDVDGDGDLDIVNGRDDSAAIRLLENAKGTWLTWKPTAIPYPATFGPYTSSAICDLNLDGYPDIIVGSGDAALGSGNSAMVWLRNGTLGGARWARGEIAGISPLKAKVDELVCKDIDGDGDPDITFGDQGNEDNDRDTADEQAWEGFWWAENPCL